MGKDDKNVINDTNNILKRLLFLLSTLSDTLMKKTIIFEIQKPILYIKYGFINNNIRNENKLFLISLILIFFKTKDIKYLKSDIE